MYLTIYLQTESQTYSQTSIILANSNLRYVSSRLASVALAFSYAKLFITLTKHYEVQLIIGCIVNTLLNWRNLSMLNPL